MTDTPEFYRVEEQGRPPDECQCANCKLWTVVYDDDGEPTEIGTSYQGDDGKEAAEDVCGLMNMAFDLGRETRLQAAFDEAVGEIRMCHDKPCFCKYCYEPSSESNGD